MVNAAGAVLVPLDAEVGPIEVEAPVASAPFQLALVTVTVSPDWDQFPDQPWVSCWLPL